MRWILLLSILLLPLSLEGEAQIGQAGRDAGLRSNRVATKRGLQDLLNREGKLYLVVPELTPWALYLGSLRGYRDTLYFIPERSARSLCSSLPDYARLVRVVKGMDNNPLGAILPREDRRSVGGSVQGDLFASGTFLEGDGLYREMNLLELEDPLARWFFMVGPRRARAYVTGSPSQGNLTAQVEIWEEEWVRDSTPSLIGNYTVSHPWNARLTLDLGRGNETLTATGYDPSREYTPDGSGNWPKLRLYSGGEDVGYVEIRSNGSLVDEGVDYDTVIRGEAPGCCGHGNTNPPGNPFSFDTGTGGRTYIEVLYSRQTRTEGICFIGCLIWDRYYDVTDNRGRYRGKAHGTQRGDRWAEEVEIHPIRWRYQKSSEDLRVYARRWRYYEGFRPKGTYPVGPGGVVVVGGETYTIPELAAYGRPGAQLAYTDGSPMVTYIARSLGLEEGNLATGRLVGDALAPKPLEEFCRNLNR